VATRITDLRGVEGGYAALDDRLLVLDFQAGHPEAFVEIHRRYGGLARHVCARYLPNPADADEAFQEAMIRVFQGLYRFNGRYALQPWVARIATNVSLDIIRGRARRPSVDDRSLDEHDREDPREGPDEAVERLVQRDLILAVLADMPDAHRRALVLRELEGLSHKEIGEELDLSPSQAKALIHRAKGTFRRRWMHAVADRGGFMAFALAPAMWAMRAIGGARRVVDKVAQATIATDAVSGAASSAPTVTFTAERMVAAATVTVLLAGGVTVGAVTLRQASTNKADRQQAAVVAPPTQAPQVEQPPVVVKAARVKVSKHDPEAVAALTLETSVEPTPPPPESSPSPPPTTGPSGSPSPPPALPPAPPWSLSFESSVALGTWQPGLLSSSISGTAGHDLTFSQTVVGPMVTAEGDVSGRLYVEYFGGAQGSSGSVTLWIILDTQEGRYRYEATGNLASLTEAESGAVDYLFTGDYYLVEWPAPDDGSAAADPAPTLHDGTLQLALGIWGNGTTLYEVGISFQESPPSPGP